MQVNDTLHGFTVRSVRPLPELSADMVEMEYTKNGAKLVWLDRPDDNMTFAIAFKTVPEDDTGVFHILEHSVLNGSDKYPTKEPFVDLLKTSLQTFLNAFTFPDKTMYPVSSRNRRDFLNLTDVYMDAVLHPRILKKEETFLQEGWHYEFTEAGELTRSGVVYSEMKGDYASVETQLNRRMFRMLFGDTCYGFESGGDPAAIPTLTYEAFRAAHKRFYHPSNSYIVLDGQIPVDETLALLDGYLAAYDRSDKPVHITERAPQTVFEDRGFYEVDEDEPETDRTQLAIGYITGRYDDPVKTLGLEILADTLCGTNEAPLRKAILEKNLAETLSMDDNNSAYYTLFTLTARNTDSTKTDALRAEIDRVLAEQAGGALDHSQLAASINSLEFALHERDYGTTPRGIVNAIGITGAWLYGGDPAQNLVFEEFFRTLRANLETGWFEQLIREAFLENRDKATVILEPSKTLGAEREAKLSAELAALAEGWSDAEKEAVRAKAAALTAMQQAPDTPEQLATLPKLTLNDLSDGPKLTLPEAETVDGSTLLTLETETAGILYADVYFDLADLTTREISALAFAVGLFGELGTRATGVGELQKRIKGELGTFGCAVEAFAPLGQPLTCTPYAAASVSVLESRKASASGLLCEMLTETVFSNTKLIAQMLRQRKLGMREAIIDSGNSFAMMQANSCSTAKGVLSNATSGLAMYDWLCAADEECAKDPAAFAASLEAFCRRVFVRGRATVAMTGKKDPDWAKTVLAALPEGEPMGAVQPIILSGAVSRGIVVPAEVSFAGLSVNLFTRGSRYSGEMNVGALHLSYNDLWNVIRVQNGAYGAGIAVPFGGDVRMYTYRDPNPANSLAVFRDTGAWLKENIPSADTLESLIIGSVGETDVLRTPRLNSKLMANWYFSRVPEDTFTLRHRGILAANAENLTAFAETLTRVTADAPVCVIGSRAQVEKCGLAEVTNLPG